MVGTGRCRLAAHPRRNRTPPASIGCGHGRRRRRGRAPRPRRRHRLPGHSGAIERSTADQRLRSASENRIRRPASALPRQKGVAGDGGGKLRPSPGSGRQNSSPSSCDAAVPPELRRRPCRSASHRSAAAAGPVRENRSAAIEDADNLFTTTSAPFAGIYF